MTSEDARKAIGKTARAILRGDISYIEGAREIVALGHRANISDDPDVIRFDGIDSETDALPFGDVRRYWQPGALEKLQPEIDRLEQWARNYGHAACQNLVIRFGEEEI